MQFTPMNIQIILDLFESINELLGAKSAHTRWNGIFYSILN